MAQAEAVQDARPDGHHILDGAADFDANRVLVDVQPERGTGERGLDGFGEFGIFRSGHDGGRLPGCNFTGERGAGNHGHTRLKARRQGFGDDGRHGQQGFVLQALSGADESHRRRKIRRHLAVDPPDQVRRDHAEDDLGPFQGLGQAVGGVDRRRDGKSGQIDVVFAGFREPGSQVLLIHPEANGFKARSKSDGEGRTPTAGPYNGQSFQCFEPLKRKTFSVPARSRAMLPLCL